MKPIIGLLALAMLSACATPPGKNTTADAIKQEMDAAAASAKGAKPDAVSDALLPPLAAEMPQLDSKPLEPRFDLAVNNTSAQQVFTAIVSGTRYSILVPADVSGSMSLNLKDVTVLDALEAIRETYGYDYKVDGTRIYVQTIGMQTRIYQVSYLTGQRNGTSSLRVASSSIGDSTAPPGTPGAAPGAASTSKSPDSSRVSTTSSADFWDELSRALKAIVGDEKGRSVVISPMTGVIVVRAMPEELSNVAAYLKASQISVERQVILEAKIVEVQLSDVFQSGVNWAAFGRDPATLGSAGHLGAGTTLQPSTGGVGAQLSNNVLSSTPGTDLVSNTNNSGNMFGLAFQTSNFAALLNFLEAQGSVHVLSSPRIATLNNQKAVLKVGTDEFFVTGVTTTTSAVGSTTTTTPTVTLQPFFSGIALDVTPRIDGNNEIILHVHPSVGQVSTVNKVLDLGATAGTYTLPLASSSISETDSIVRAHDGQIVAIGGLMRQATVEDESGLPGMSKRIFGQTSKRTEKRELVILIKPTIVSSDKDWSDDITRSRDRVNGMTR
ncbi:MAG TPA: secretin N-terminal domain-containing protein [Gallionellaceae bacterium]|nr:secretin N-terminal domain-containing protein [Gallionellaceae bacterium]